MTVMRSATLGFALALGASGAQTPSVAQTVISRQIQNGLVETTVTQTPAGTVITRQPLAATPASTTYVDETVGAAPTTRAAAHHIVHHPRHTASQRAASERTARHTVRTTRRVAARPLELAPSQRRLIYRTLVQEQLVPQVVVEAPPVVPGYPPFPAPAYQPRTVVVEPSATTGYPVSVPAEGVDDDLYAEQAAPVYAAPGPVYAVGTVLPASVAVAPLPASATVAVPSVRPYEYATVDNRVLLVDPVTNAVVADVTP